MEKGRDIVGLHFHPPEHAVVLCVDEKSQTQARNRTPPVLPLRPGEPERQTHHYQRNGAISLFAALNVATGEVTGKRYRHRSAGECKKYLALMDKSVPETHEVHRILDNYGTHETAQTHNGLRRPPYPLHLAPTRASWLHQVERWLAEVTRQRIRRGTLRSTQAPEAAIREYQRSATKAPHP